MKVYSVVRERDNYESDADYRDYGNRAIGIYITKELAETAIIRDRAKIVIELLESSRYGEVSIKVLDTHSLKARFKEPGSANNSIRDAYYWSINEYDVKEE